MRDVCCGVCCRRSVDKPVRVVVVVPGYFMIIFAGEILICITDFIIPEN